MKINSLYDKNTDSPINALAINGFIITSFKGIFSFNVLNRTIAEIINAVELYIILVIAGTTSPNFGINITFNIYFIAVPASNANPGTASFPIPWSAPVNV